MNPADISKKALVGNLEIRLNGKANFKISTKDKGNIIYEKVPIAYSNWLTKGNVPVPVNVFDWVCKFKSKNPSFNLKGLEDNASYHMIIVPDKKILAYTERKLDDLVSFENSINRLEEQGYDIQKYTNLQNRELAYGPIGIEEFV
jgi:hypothetical protein|tara:strand:+ start:521 stop:955 length:435 start_codon:yes stop_codon:yes gene_type:complete